MIKVVRDVRSLAEEDERLRQLAEHVKYLQQLTPAGYRAKVALHQFLSQVDEENTEDDRHRRYARSENSTDL